ncbi:uncharacterized protein PHALS_05432 [Plasmopara halstedii]|uniref:Uncharacterized protein n=1 Tax=Plasmopara halstedii TaxID=4781 RepID=A0A0P1AB51_PLAHL|nr:uncharacterized protein PHALS_05432 [Plasmopara halstedii]CEG37654.1 hypothetical protein PHALS_05432 [Plasmopara halstedii]|eukprot:XP_024574023.1 hypothetical protein PHALS_05432 [Plasmopara halstedii]
MQLKTLLLCKRRRNGLNWFKSVELDAEVNASPVWRPHQRFKRRQDDNNLWRVSSHNLNSYRYSAIYGFPR